MASQQNQPKKSKQSFDRDQVQSVIRRESDRVSYSIFSKLDKFNKFRRVEIDKQVTDYVVCLTCNDKYLIRYVTTKGASNINKHLELYNKDNQPRHGSKQLELEKIMYQKVKLVDKQAIADATAICCAVDFRPFTIIEGEGFRELVQEIIKITSKRGLIKAEDLLPSAETVRNHTVTLYDQIKTKLIDDVKSIESVNCTTDHWMEKYSGQNYMTITIQHFNNDSKQLINLILGTFPVTDKKSITTIDNFVKQLGEFGLKHKLRIVVTDNASSMSSAFKKVDWVGCAAHNLALCHADPGSP